MEEATMTRRTLRLLVTLTIGLLSAPLTSDAQQAGKVYRIGWLATAPRTTPALQSIEEAFLQGLRDHGFVEGQNVIIERRYSEGRQDRYAALVTEFVHMQVDVIITGNSAAVRAATQATSTIPIVMLGVANPERQGLVASLARPGGNVTGMSNQLGGDLSGKMFELLKEALPQLSKVAIIWNPDNLGSAISFREGEAPAAKALGVTLVSLEVRGPEDLDRILTTITTERPDALWVHLVAVPFRARLLEFAAQHRLPTVAQASTWPQFGGLMSYGPNLDDLFRRAATHVAKILKGARPADLPVEQPTTFELVINLKTAQALGLTIPPTLLFQATEVIR
jgi:putative tryptophan/tyrosine transport system substrate-binding protein